MCQEIYPDVQTPHGILSPPPITHSYATSLPCSLQPSWPAFPPKPASSPVSDLHPRPTPPAPPPSSYTYRYTPPYFPPRSPYPPGETTRRRRSIQNRIPIRGGRMRGGAPHHLNHLMDHPARHASRSTVVRRRKSSCLRVATIRRTIWPPARCSRRRLGFACLAARPTVRGRQTLPWLALNLPAAL